MIGKPVVSGFLLPLMGVLCIYATTVLDILAPGERRRDRENGREREKKEVLPGGTSLDSQDRVTRNQGEGASAGVRMQAGSPRRLSGSNDTDTFAFDFSFEV